ncbi:MULTISPECIES: DUF4837 family protein [unclassified Capnocytophaga]|jgi:hypothetical protein|uniref:DUF4837 family protein n=1 Tax=unclassified Capnocytophaga TaxID=2640652 RepID=UPI000202F4E2|nr:MULTISPECIES: DUF4837 family protein [unclassified Capnocytophaga]EGD33633.1 hypothetical protein HMPREF9071_1795 [Capnocytophaga sp. oral taxon 338 str. F0234]MEB3004461.1 DUF4837 family protein [Capnocytophaga sp. G2]
MKKIFLYNFITLLLISCNEGEKKQYLPQSVGSINSLTIVIDPPLWNGIVGDSLRHYFASPVEEISGAREPIFDIQQIPEDIFKGMTRASRNVLIVTTDSKNRFDIRDTLFAKPQKVAFLIGETTDDLISEIKRFAPEIILTFKQNEMKEVQNRFRQTLNNTKAIEQILNIHLTFPSVYNIVKQENNFFWLERKVKNGTANILIYEVPKGKICANNKDCTEQIIHMRDSIGAQYVPGPEEGMYMITSTAFAPTYSRIHINSYSTIESKGLWEVKGFILGGPFSNYIIEDPKRERCVVIEGFIAAPGTSKRDLLFELETIIKSVRFLD